MAMIILKLKGFCLKKISLENGLAGFSCAGSEWIVSNMSLNFSNSFKGFFFLFVFICFYLKQGGIGTTIYHWEIYQFCKALLT